MLEINLFNYDLPIFKFNKKKINVFESFAGIGCQRLALDNLNVDYDLVGISEIDSNVIEAYNLIHGETKNFGDINNINPKDLDELNIDLFTYSFPCQDLSLIGLKKGITKQTRSGLVFSVLNLISSMNNKPKVLLLENVKNLLSKKFSSSFENILFSLEKLGYKNYVKVFKGIDFNIPQYRERVFVISILGDFKYFFPKKQNQTVFVNDFLEKNVSDEYYLSESFIKYCNSTSGKFERAKFFKCLDINKSHKFIRAITTNEGNVVTSTFIKDSVGIRKLTEKELFRFMGIDDLIYLKIKDKFPKYKIRHFVGNGIIVPVLQHIFSKLF